MKNNVYILKKPYHFDAEQTELSYPQTGYVTLEYLYCGICGGDYSYFIGRRKDYPITLGHEFVARVINAENNPKFNKGDIVVSDLNYRCGVCHFCISGKSHLCIRQADGLFTNRGFARYANVHGNYLYTIPQIEWLPSACFIEPLSCVIHACELIPIKPSSHILIVGGGSIGTMFAFYLKTNFNCINIEITEKIARRAETLMNCFDIRISDPRNGCYDLVIDCSNTPEGVMTALKAAGRGGNICVMSHLYGINTTFIYEMLCREEINAYFPLRNGDIHNMHSAINHFAAHWETDYNALIQIYDDINKAFLLKNQSPCNKQVIRINH